MTDEHSNYNNNHNNNIFNPTDSNLDSFQFVNSINSISNTNNFNSIISLDSNTNSNTVETNNKPTLYCKKTWIVATQNIRGINDEFKQQLWWQYCIENKLDIVVLTETKLIKRNEWTTFYNSDKTTTENIKSYSTWWASKTKGGRGSGVGIMVCSELAPHVYKIDRFKARAICIYLSFKGKFKVQIIAVYAPTRTTAHKKDIKELNFWLTNKYSEALSKNMISIALGDWNAVSNPRKDRFPSKLSALPESPVLHSLINMGYEDCNQMGNDSIEKFTYQVFYEGQLHNASRLDQIWIHPNYLDRISSYQVEDTALFAKSDHHLVRISIDASQWWDNRQYRRTKQFFQKKKSLWNLKDATVEHWDKFASTLDNLLGAIDGNNSGNNNLEYKWENMKTAIISAGNQELPKSKEPKNKINVCRNTHKDFGLINLLSKIHRVGKLLMAGKSLSNITIKKFEQNCSLLNSKRTDVISPFPCNGIENQIEWVENIRNMWSTLKKVVKLDMLHTRDKRIKRYIDRRQGFLESSPIRMISSALEREQRRIILDRVIKTNDNGSVQIITTPEDIKTEVKSHLHQWTLNPRDTDINFTSQWTKQYTPQEHISSTIYESLLAPISLQETEEVIVSFGNGKAPGPTQIPYEIYKHLSTTSMKAMIEIFNEVLSSGRVPRDWTNSSVVLIPKPKDWEGNLEITRPITLMETI